MFLYALEDIARAMAREREEEARRLQTMAEASGSHPHRLRSRLARLLVLAGVRLDPTAGESALTAAEGCR